MVKNRKALRIGWIVFLLLLCCGCGKKEENGSANGSVVDLMEGIEEDRMGDMEDTSEGGVDLKAENNFFIEDTTGFARKCERKERGKYNVIAGIGDFSPCYGGERSQGEYA